MSLDVVKKFKGRNSQPLSIDASKNYLIIGYRNNHVDVHSLNELDQNGTHQKRMASNFFLVSKINSNYNRNISMVALYFVLVSRMIWFILLGWVTQ